LKAFTKVLGIDYGTKNIGLAIAVSFVAIPMEPIKQEGYKKSLKKIVQEKAVEAIVIGLPLSMSGRFSESTLKAISFAVKLKKHFKLPIFMVDERLSTVSARKVSELDGKEFRRYKDSLSALEILNRYLENPMQAYEIRDNFPECRIVLEERIDLKGKKVLLFDPPTVNIENLEEFSVASVDIYTSDPALYLFFRRKGFFPKNLMDDIEFMSYDIIVLETSRDLVSGFRGKILEFLCS